MTPKTNHRVFKFSSSECFWHWRTWPTDTPAGEYELETHRATWHVCEGSQPLLPARTVPTVSSRFIREMTQETQEPFHHPGYTSVLDNALKDSELFNREVAWIRESTFGWPECTDPRISKD